MKSWKDLPIDVLKTVADMCDGHSILKPEALVEAGVPQKLVDKYTETLESDFSDPKSTIFGENGEPIAELRGVYGYRVLQRIVGELNLQAGNYLGRGFQANAWKRAISEYVDEHNAAST